MKQYGYLPLTQSSAQAADGGRRSPMTDAAALPARENPYKNTAKNLCMCGFCVNTHTHTHRLTARNIHKNCLKNNTLPGYFFGAQGTFFVRIFPMLILWAMPVLFPGPDMALCRIRTNPQKQHLSPVMRTILPSLTCYALVATLIFLLSSCSKEEHNTPHPDQGVIAVTVDYPQGAEEDDYTVEVDGQPLDEGDNASDPLTPGEHTVLVYNTPEGFTVTDGIAYVERVDGTRALSGVAGAYDLRGEALYGEAVSTRPAFTRSGDKVSAGLRLLGIMGDRQTLTLVLTFTDGQTQTTESDLTEALAGFGSDMTEPFTLTAGLRTPMEAGFSASITDWEVVDGGHVDIH